MSTLRAALTAVATDRIEQRVTGGDLIQAEADERLARLPEHITALLTEEIADRPSPGGHHGPTPAHAEAESAAGA